jgi:hypothetical protein
VCVDDRFDQPGGGAQAVEVPEVNEKALIDEVQHRLADVYAHLPADQISTVVAQAHARFEHSAVRDFIPLLVERRARAELSRHIELLAAAG